MMTITDDKKIKLDVEFRDGNFVTVLVSEAYERLNPITYATEFKLEWQYANGKEKQLIPVITFLVDWTLRDTYRKELYDAWYEYIYDGE